MSRDTPRFIPPMAATLHDRAFSDPDWVYERKLDGVRLQVVRDGDDVAVWSRNRKRVDAGYPELVEAADRLPGRCVVDGEVVAPDGDLTSFERLQGRMQLRDPDAVRATGIAVVCYLFDLLHLDGADLLDLPLRERKARLRAAVGFDDPWRFSAHRNGDGEAFLEEACARRWEGLIAKRADSRYVPGSRSREWLKLKCTARQEFVIGGWTDPAGARVGLGALLVGYHDERGRLRYAGKVGTGYSQQVLRDLAGRLAGLARDTPPFDRIGRVAGAHWVEPVLVCEVAFTEWTRDGRLRHPAFLGLREDKDPADVVREVPG